MLWSYLGDILLTQVRDQEAEPVYQAALRYRPNDFDSLLGLGSVCANLNRLDEARSHLERALAVNPSSGPARLRLAIVLDRQNETGPARTEYLRAIESGADEPQAHFRLGVLFARDNQPAEALKHLRIAFQRQPGKYVPMVRNELRNIRSDLDSIRYTKAFSDLLKEFEIPARPY